MPVYKDEKNSSWYCKFYYTDWTGERKQKLKRGFKLQREAKEWERSFLEQQQANPDMTFGSLYALYIEDMSKRLKLSTLSNKKYTVDLKILPYFKNKPINQIKAADIRKWQNKLMSGGYSATYLKSINNQLTAILNYAVKYYGLRENPCHKAGSIGKKNADEMQFWTKDEFTSFEKAIKDKPRSHIAFMVLYWSGMRIGELMALTPSDIDFESFAIRINKSYQRLNGNDIITTPKTPKSNRTVIMPKFVMFELKAYIEQLYDLQPDDRIFDFTKFFLHHEMDRGCKISGVKRIRLHDLRHSHASLLIELGASPLLIAERLGHENIETTLSTYSHLYPNKQSEIIEKINKIVSN